MNETKQKKSWKLFGKLNIIDLLIIAAILVAVVVLGLRTLNNRAVTNAGQHVRVTYYGFDKINDYVPQSFQKGDPLIQYQTNIGMGELVDWSYEPAYELALDPDTGEVAELPLLGQVFVHFTAECYGRLDRTGLTIENTTFVVGGNYYINVGPTRAGYQITSFELID